MNKKIGRNFKVFTPGDFTALITQHIRDKSFQRVRYYEWYSNKMHGRRAKQADEEVQTEVDAVEVSDVLPTVPCRTLKEVARVDQKKGGARPAAVARSAHGEDVMSHSARIPLGSGKRGCACHSGTDPSGQTTLDPWLDDRLRHRTVVCVKFCKKEITDKEWGKG